MIAPGTNESPGWSRADYVASVGMVPRSTEVFFVRTYRRPEVFGQERASQHWVDIVEASVAHDCPCPGTASSLAPKT